MSSLSQSLDFIWNTSCVQFYYQFGNCQLTDWTREAYDHRCSGTGWCPNLIERLSDLTFAIGYCLVNFESNPIIHSWDLTRLCKPGRSYVHKSGLKVRAHRKDEAQTKNSNNTICSFDQTEHLIPVIPYCLIHLICKEGKLCPNG